MAILIVFSKGFVGDLEAFSLAAIHVAALPTGFVGADKYLGLPAAPW
jgi:hypothetical protein